MDLRAPVLSALLLTCAWPTPRAHACSCVATTFEQALESADAIFEGVVTGVKADERVGKRVELRVVRIWKGDEREEKVEVLTASNSAACGVGFEEGTGYLVYATREGGDLFASLCSRTRPSDQAGEDFAKLGAGVTPVELDTAENSPALDEGPGSLEATKVPKGGFASCSAHGPSRASGGVGLLLIAGLGLGLRRRGGGARAC